MHQSAFGTHRRITLLAAVALASLWLIVYASTVSPSVNFIDSGELITALHEPGVAHPPGYPLYTLMGYVVSNLLPGEIAWRVNILSAFWGAIAVGAFFLFLVALLNYLSWLGSRRASKLPARQGRKSTRKSPVAVPSKAATTVRGAKATAVVNDQAKANEPLFWRLPISDWLTYGVAASVASLLGASATFWSRTAQAKMYTLHYFFVALLFLCALLARWAFERNDDRAMRRWLLALNIGLGLSLSNHLMTVLLVPGLLLMLLAGSEPSRRLKALLSRWMYGIPAVAIPVLLYLYLPLRASQHPLMNWGTTDSLGDFWRHITGWQYGAYLTGTNFSILWGFIVQQWSWLTAILLVACIASGALLARAHLAVFVATLTTAAATLLFAWIYGISEIEPYLVPLYIMLLVWLATAPFTLSSLLKSRKGAARGPSLPLMPITSGLAVLLLLSALVTTTIQYSDQNHIDDHLAGQFVENALSELPTNSILLTDYWDFYSPTIYLQNILKLRPDVSIVDIPPLKYPWYLGYLEKYSPELIEKSQDLLPFYQAQQRLFVNGEKYDQVALPASYFRLINSFVERNINTRPAYVLFQPCGPRQNCESAQIATNYERIKVGLTSKLMPKPAPSQVELPPEPSYKLQGILEGSRVPMDDFARINSCLYVEAYAVLSQQYIAANKAEQGQKLASMASSVRDAIPGQCR